YRTAGRKALPIVKTTMAVTATSVGAAQALGAAGAADAAAASRGAAAGGAAAGRAAAADAAAGDAAASSEAGDAVAGGEGGKPPAGECKCGGTCFVAGTSVDTADHPKAIEEIALGDRVGPEARACANADFGKWFEIHLEMVARSGASADTFEI